MSYESAAKSRAIILARMNGDWERPKRRIFSVDSPKQYEQREPKRESRPKVFVNSEKFRTRRMHYIRWWRRRAWHEYRRWIWIHRCLLGPLALLPSSLRGGVVR